MRTVWRDLRFGVRVLVKAPAFAAAAVITLALGIGANTAIFSVVDAVLFRPLPYPDPDRLVTVWTRNPESGFSRGGSSLQDFQDWRSRSRCFESIGVQVTRGGVLSAGGEPIKIDYALADPGLFSALAVQPSLGRLFRPEENDPGADSVAILSDGLWRDVFGARASVLGEDLRLGGERLTIVGVMPAGFRYPRPDVGLWKPFGMKPDDGGSRDGRWVYTTARLRRGVTLEQADSDIRRVAAELARDYPKTNAGVEAFVEPLLETEVGDVRPALYTLWAIVGLVLLIASVNVANLLLARGLGREKEMALRAALGASKRRLVRQLLTESLLLATVGGVVGVVLATWSVRLLPLLDVGWIPRWEGVSVNSGVLATALGATLLLGCLFGVVPAWRGSRVELQEALKGDGRSAGGGRRNRALGLLVVGEVALALIVLAGAGLMLRSFANILSVDLGFRPEGLLTFRVEPPWPPLDFDQGFDRLFATIQTDRGRAASFYRQLIERLEAYPGVLSAAAVNRMPLSGNWWTTAFALQGSAPDASHRPTALVRVVTPGYFKTMAIPLLAGRGLTGEDRSESQPVVVVNQAALSAWAGSDPLGTRLTCDDDDNPNKFWYTVVGVVGDVRPAAVEAEPEPILYIAFPQARWGHSGDWGMDLVVRTQGTAEGLPAFARQAVRELDSGLPVFQTEKMAEVVAQKVATRRFNAVLLSLFALTALTLAGVGIYGVVSFSVSRRMGEIGIRMALGAERSDILRMVLGWGALLSLVGVVMGLGVALLLSRAAEAVLFGVAGDDPLTLAAASAILLTVSVLAGLAPALRALRADPAAPLRGF